jgi:hypothetical protein
MTGLSRLNFEAFAAKFDFSPYKTLCDVGGATGLLMSLNMLIEFGEAFDFSGADFRKWCGEVGFKRFEVLHLSGPSSAAVAWK